MSVWDRVRAVVANPYDPSSLGGRARARRWELFAERFPDIGDMRVVDLGGVHHHWLTAPVRPREVVLVNTGSWGERHWDESVDYEAGWIRVVEGDACDPPRELLDDSFDLVYSNSVIEHVGGPWRRAAFARSAHALAPRHWVQTPYRYFPLEPHWAFPGLQLLPLRARVFLTERWPLSPRYSMSREHALDYTLSVDLLDKTEMRYLFPASEIYEERAAGLVKSLVAIR